MKEIDKEADYRCLECGKEFGGFLAVPVWHDNKIMAYKCPYCKGKIEFRGFEFNLDIDLPDEIITDIEDQMVNKVKERLGGDYSGDDIEDYKYIFRAKVTVKRR